ncbi:MarR family winged helix-turn-helix transcriptional regulator [Rhodanobacter soli]|mgnify:CR=1 FL=1|jgi:MarR family transcriptional regulator, transcriptional regulator for hemolysin|nr:MarR family transcriptional regulator [Rhodanobacter sp.]
MDDKTTWNETLTWILMPVGRLWCRAVGKAFESLGVSLSAGAPILAVAEIGDGVRQNVVADAIGVDNAALVRSLDKLEAVGLLERRADPVDRRARTLHLTREGRALAKKLNAALATFRQQVLAQISEKDGAAAVRVLRAIELASLQSLGEAVDPND